MTEEKTRCMKCNHEAIIYQPYSGMHLCKKHFTEDVERKVKLTIRKNYNIGKNEKIAVALSGGKDSCVALYILNKIFGKRRDLELVAITVDEGISVYRERSIGYARKLTCDIGVKHLIHSFADEYDTSLDELAAKERAHGACSYCGVLRKSLVNRIALDIGAKRLVTGHNLDDEAQTIMMNHLGGDVERMIRLSPPRELDGLVLRAKPLRKIPENEVELYAKVCLQCRTLQQTPQISIQKGFDKMVGILARQFPQAEIKKCTICGQACTTDVCQACRLLGKT